MKSRNIFFLLFLIASLINLPCHAVPAKVGKIDLNLATSLHPQMSIFDFDRMGFFKIPLGLNEKEFLIKLKKLRDAPPSKELDKDEATANKLLADLNQKISELSDKMTEMTPANGKRLRNELQMLAEKSKEQIVRLEDIKYQRNCPDLTSPAETRKILDKIESEVIETLRSVKESENISLVLNSSITFPFNFPDKYMAGGMYGLGVPGIDYSLFYSFLANNDHRIKGDDTPESRKMINWLELTNSPAAIDLLPIKPWPLVISGGINLTPKVIELLYNKHNIDPKVIKAVLSVLDVIDQRSQKYDKNIESTLKPE